MQSRGFLFLMLLGLSAVRLASCETTRFRQLQAAPTMDPNQAKQADEAASQVGKKVRQSMKDFRGGNDKFYQNLFDALRIVQCDSQKDKHSKRWVLKTDPEAYLENGACKKIPLDVVAQSEYAVGMCERKPNCYWSDFNTTDSSRRPVYALDAAPPVEGAMTLVDANKVLEDWGKGFITFVAPGIVLGVLSFLTCVLFIVCRCLCNKCGGRSPDADGYTCCQKLVPLIILLIFALGIAITAGMAFVYNKQVTTGIKRVFAASKETLDNSTKWIDRASAPLVSVKNTVLKTVDDIGRELNGTSFIEDGVNGITSRLSKFETNTAGVSLPRNCAGKSGRVCFPCTACTDFKNKIAQVNKDVDQSAKPGIEKLKKTRTALNKDLKGIGNQIKTSVDENVAKTDNMKKSIDDMKKSIDDVDKTFSAQDKIRLAGVLAMFALALVVVAITLVGVIFSVTPLSFLVHIMHLAYLLGFITLVLGFIISSVLIALSVLMSDGCEIMNIMTKDFTPVVGAGAATGINACFANTSLLVAYNLSDKFSFADTVSFPTLNVSSMLEFGPLKSFGSSVSNLNSSTFSGFNPSQTNSLITTLNSLTGLNQVGCTPQDSNYTSSNIQTPWLANGDPQPGHNDSVRYMLERYQLSSAKVTTTCNNLTSSRYPCFGKGCNYTDRVKQLYQNITDILKVGPDMTAFLDGMKTNMTELTTYVDGFSNDTKLLVGKFDKMKTGTTSELIKHVDDFKAAMYCGFVKTGFFSLYDAMCATTLTAFTMISLMIFLMCCFLIPLNVCVIILSKRLRGGSAGGGGDKTEYK